MSFPASFLWGASTAPHQIEGNNVNSEWWAREPLMPGMELSGDACDSYHRYREDMELLASAGLNSYRFGIEWARIEPRPGQFSRAELAHYRRMIDTALSLHLKPVVTLQHGSCPRWFAEEGGWNSGRGPERFAAYVTEATTILDGVEWVATINEPNMMSVMLTMMEAARTGQLGEWQSPTAAGDPNSDKTASPMLTPSPEFAQYFIDAHHSVRDIVRSRTGAKVGWTIANQAFTAAPGNEVKLEEVRYAWEDIFLDAAVGDDFIGVQSYSWQDVDENGPVPYPNHPDNTLVGTPFRPEALGMAVRHTWERTGGIPILVTENGIAIADDARRIDYTRQAFGHLEKTIDDGIDVRGYLHWSLLDNYEWGHWHPTFGLIAVDRQTFVRTPKPSLNWLGQTARSNGLTPAPVA